MSSRANGREAELKGQTLEMICFNANQVYFHFGLRSHVVVEGRYNLRGGLEDHVGVFDVPNLPSGVVQYFGKTVAACGLNQDGNLVIELSGGAQIEVLKDLYGHESFRVVIDGTDVVLS